MICARRFMSTTTAQLLSANEFRHPCSRLRTSTAAGPGDHAGGITAGNRGHFPRQLADPGPGSARAWPARASLGGQSPMIAAGGGLGSQGTRLSLSASRSSRTQPCSAVETLRSNVQVPPSLGVEHRYWASWSGGPWPVWMQELLGPPRKVTSWPGRVCNNRSAAMLRV